MPPFGSKGKTVAIYAVGTPFTVGEAYEVDFASRKVSVQAAFDDRIEVKVPKGLDAGPVAIRVTGPGMDHTYDDALFTALSKPRRIRNSPGFYFANDYEAAVTRDGSLLLALNLRRVLDPRQFMMGFLDLPLAYDAEDVVIYNKDGVDLTLFTAEVADPTLRQWGSYYGWSVEDDSGLSGQYYSSQTDDDNEANVGAGISNIFTYWRHEFHSYYNAHLPGSGHEVDGSGLHPDLTRHVDHYNLVISIRGKLRDPSNPMDATLFTPLEPGSQRVTLGWVSFDTETPFEPGSIANMMGMAEGPLAELLEEMELDDD